MRLTGKWAYMETVTFLDQNTKEEVSFVVEEETTVNGVKYLLVSEEAEDGDCDAYILKEIRTEEEEAFYQMVEDDVEFTAIAKVFSELADEDTQLMY